MLSDFFASLGVIYNSFAGDFATVLFDLCKIVPSEETSVTEGSPSVLCEVGRIVLLTLDASACVTIDVHAFIPWRDQCAQK